MSKYFCLVLGLGSAGRGAQLDYRHPHCVGYVTQWALQLGGRGGSVLDGHPWLPVLDLLHARLDHCTWCLLCGHMDDGAGGSSAAMLIMGVACSSASSCTQVVQQQCAVGSSQLWLVCVKRTSQHERMHTNRKRVHDLQLSDLRLSVTQDQWLCLARYPMTPPPCSWACWACTCSSMGALGQSTCPCALMCQPHCHHLHARRSYSYFIPKLDRVKQVAALVRVLCCYPACAQCGSAPQRSCLGTQRPSTGT
jgi:hypothetical protein